MTKIDEFLPNCSHSSFLHFISLCKMSPIALIVTPGINPFFISVPRMVFDSFCSEGHRREMRLCAESPGRIEIEGGLSAEIETGLEALASADLIIIPFWPDPQQPPGKRLIASLQNAHARGTLIAGLCRGGFVLGYAGLLDGKRATAHWCDAETFQRMFPAVRVDPKALYIDEGDLITSAGIAAGIDCCLHILRRTEGAQCANETARRLVAPPFREGGQAQFIENSVPLRTSDARINAVIEEMKADLSKAFSIQEAASKSAMSERSFFRAFRRSTGLTPAKWLALARMKRAQELLESTSASIEEIAAACGFDSPVTFRQCFQKSFSVSPSAWRHTFSPKEGL